MPRVSTPMEVTDVSAKLVTPEMVAVVHVSLNYCNVVIFSKRIKEQLKQFTLITESTFK